MSIKTFMRQLSLERCRFSVSQLRAINFVLGEGQPEDAAQAQQSIAALIAILDEGLGDLEEGRPHDFVTGRESADGPEATNCGRDKVSHCGVAIMGLTMCIGLV